MRAGAVVYVDCVQGYRLTRGRKQITCVQDAEYTGIPTCTLDTCSAIPPSIFNLKSEVEFPVYYGGEVEVGCAHGYSIVGDSTITCLKDTLFSYDVEPRLL